MTSTSNGPRKPRKPPLGRRLKYLVQDAGYAAKKTARKVTDPVRDAKGPRPSRPAKPKVAAATKAVKPTSPKPKPKPKTTGARELGERPDTPKRRPPRRASVTRRRGAATRRRRGESRRRGAVRPRRRDGAGRRRRIPRPTASGIAGAITRFGERSSQLIRRALSPLLPPLLAVAALGRRLLAWLARVVTPLRAALFVTAIAAILLGISQFADYRGVAIGVPDYAAYEDAQLVAPAPQVDRETAGSAHAYLLVPVAALALGLLFLCARGRWQLGWVVALLGIFGIAVSLLVDVPAGLDESVQAVAYEGVEARLIEGFYAQLFASAVLVAGGLLVARYARRASRRAPRPRRRPATVGPARASAT